MKVYKEHSFLVFDLDDGSTVKYDFATNKAFGKKGGLVVDLKRQLKNITLNQIFESCTDPQYAKFLKFVRSASSSMGKYISNIGTILSRVPYYADYEQFFSSGINRVDSYIGKYTFADVPQGLIKLCRKYDLCVSERLIKSYKELPDVYNLASSLDFISLDFNDIQSILQRECSQRVPNTRTSTQINVVKRMITEFGYQPKALLLYLDRLKTYEALSDMGKIIKELFDYATMMMQIGAKFDRYPRHFLTTHAIASRNYNRLNVQFVESQFQSRIKPDMERIIGDYAFIYPHSTQDIKDEAVQMNNCVASYIQGVIDGDHDIIFMRNKDRRDKSLVTCEVQGNTIVQALQRYNDPLTADQVLAVEQWNKWYKKKKEAEKDAGNQEVRQNQAC